MDYFFLILLGTIWGTSYLFINLRSLRPAPVTLVAMRTTLAGLALLALLARRDKLPRATLLSGSGSS